ncbi:YlbF/YmcA family competence regulator [Halanaerobaculum tunisiense]
MAIMEKAQDLADAIVDSEEYKALKDIEAKVAEDEEAQGILQELQAEQKKAQMAQMNGQAVADETKNKLQSLQAKMEDHEKLKELMGAQEKFNEVMETVNKVISGALSDEEDCQDDNCGEGCC